MSRVVPVDQPLSIEDREYLLARGHESMVATMDQQYPPDEEELAAWDARRRGVEASLFTGDTGVVDQLRARVAQLEEYITEELEADLPPAPGEEPEPEEKPYSEWLLSELQTEAGARGLPKSGTKPELVSRLEEHDKATA